MYVLAPMISLDIVHDPLTSEVNVLSMPVTP